MRRCKQYISYFEEVDGPSVKYEDNWIFKTKWYGVVKAGNVTVERVACVVELKHNLIIISQLYDDNNESDLEGLLE